MALARLVGSLERASSPNHPAGYDPLVADALERLTPDDHDVGVLARECGLVRATITPVESDLERLSDTYESAESAFLDAVRDRASHERLATAARAVADSASRFNDEAYKRFHSGVEDAWMPLDHLTERTEVLAALWLDLAAAYEV